MPADLMDDVRVQKLAKRHKDALVTTAALALYVCLVVACQRRGERLTLEEALPTWLGPGPADDMAANVLAHDLYRAGLLDWEHRLPAHESYLVIRRGRQPMSQTHRQAIGQGVRRFYAARRASRLSAREDSGGELHGPNAQGMAAGQVHR